MLSPDLWTKNFYPFFSNLFLFIPIEWRMSQVKFIFIPFRNESDYKKNQAEKRQKRGKVEETMGGNP